MLALSAPVDCDPLVARVPDQPPDAVQGVAFVEDHDRVALEPLEMLVGLTLSETVGTGADTEIVTDWAALPAGAGAGERELGGGGEVRGALRAARRLNPRSSRRRRRRRRHWSTTMSSVDAAPLLTVVGFPVSVTVGSGVVTVTVTD